MDAMRDSKPGVGAMDLRRCLGCGGTDRIHNVNCKVRWRRLYGSCPDCGHATDNCICRNQAA